MRPHRTPNETWDQTYLTMAGVIAQRSKDPDTQCGAVIVDTRNRVVSVGYNGPPPGVCDLAIDWNRPAKYSWVVHAEENAILFGLPARGLDGLKGCTLYVNGRPCSRCMLRVRHVGIVRLIYGGVLPTVCDEQDWRVTQEIAGKVVTLQGL